ncbi:MAG: insulinase family protein [Dakarella massiliensis]
MKSGPDSESQQAEDAFRNWFYRGSKFTDATIGKTETIKAANSDNLRPFYDTWYRSDRMVVIAVGDVNPEKTKAEIEEAFGSMKKATASDPGAVIPSLGNPTASGVRAWVEHPEGIHHPDHGLCHASTPPRIALPRGIRTGCGRRNRLLHL